MECRAQLHSRHSPNASEISFQPDLRLLHNCVFFLRAFLLFLSSLGEPLFTPLGTPLITDICPKKYMYRYAKHCHRYDPEWFLNMMLDVGAEELPPTMVGAVIVSMNIVTISFLWFFHVKPLRAALRELNAHL